MKNIEIRAGQLWGDCDPRRRGRYFEIKSVENGHAKCKSLKTGAISRISLNRLKPRRNRGYFLVVDPELLTELENLVDKLEAYALLRTPPGSAPTAPVTQ